MNIYQKKFRPSISHCILASNETPVQGGLSYTPSDMREMQKKGYPVAPQSLSEDYFRDTDNRTINDFTIDITEMRGTSINQVWETQQDARKKIREAYKCGAFEAVRKEE